MKTLLLLLALLPLTHSDDTSYWLSETTGDGVSISTDVTWDGEESVEEGLPPALPGPDFPVPVPSPSSPHYLCEFEDPAECMWDYGEKRRKPAPPAPGEVDWAQVVTIREVEKIIFAPPAIIMWPNSGDILINLPTPIMTDATQRLYTLHFSTTDVSVRATPFEYTWDYGDGVIETTDHPGLPDPKTTYKHQYLTRAPKTRITLTTTWRAEFLHPGTETWTPINGTIQTTSQTRWFKRKMAIAFLTDEAEKQQGH